VSDLLIETKQDIENYIQCSGYKTEEITSYGKSGGIAILINNNIEYEVIKELNKNRIQNNRYTRYKNKKH